MGQSGDILLDSSSPQQLAQEKLHRVLRGVLPELRPEHILVEPLNEQGTRIVIKLSKLPQYNAARNPHFNEYLMEVFKQNGLTTDTGFSAGSSKRKLLSFPSIPVSALVNLDAEKVNSELVAKMPKDDRPPHYSRYIPSEQGTRGR